MVFEYYNRTRIKETFGYKKCFHSSAFMQDKLSALIGQQLKEIMGKRNKPFSYRPMSLSFYPMSLTVFSIPFQAWASCL